MKKVYLFTFLFVLTFAFSGCNTNKDDNTVKKNTTDTSNTENIDSVNREEQYDEASDTLRSIREVLNEDVNKKDFMTELKEEKDEIQRYIDYFASLTTQNNDEKSIKNEYSNALKIGMEAIDLAEKNKIEDAKRKIDEAIKINDTTIKKYNLPID